MKKIFLKKTKKMQEKIKKIIKKNAQFIKIEKISIVIINLI